MQIITKVTAAIHTHLNTVAVLIFLQHKVLLWQVSLNEKFSYIALMFLKKTKLSSNTF